MPLKSDWCRCLLVSTHKHIAPHTENEPSTSGRSESALTGGYTLVTQEMLTDWQTTEQGRQPVAKWEC